MFFEIYRPLHVLRLHMAGSPLCCRDVVRRDRADGRCISRPRIGENPKARREVISASASCSPIQQRPLLHKLVAPPNHRRSFRPNRAAQPLPIHSLTYRPVDEMISQISEIPMNLVPSDTALDMPKDCVFSANHKGDRHRNPCGERTSFSIEKDPSPNTL